MLLRIIIRAVLTGLRNWFEVITNRWEIKGFIFMDFMAQKKAPEAVWEMVRR